MALSADASLAPLRALLRGLIDIATGIFLLALEKRELRFDLLMRLTREPMPRRLPKSWEVSFIVLGSQSRDTLSGLPAPRFGLLNSLFTPGVVFWLVPGCCSFGNWDRALGYAVSTSCAGSLLGFVRMTTPVEAVRAAPVP